MNARATLTDADLEALAAMLRRTEDSVVDRVEARLRSQRPAAQRRTRAPEVVAKLASEASGPVDELAQRKARSALAKVRAREGRR